MTGLVASSTNNGQRWLRIIREIGRGGMGMFYEATQISLCRQVALKVLPLASSLDAIRLQRFRNEAIAIAQLHHPNIVPVFAVGSERGIHFFAMQLIAGQTFASLIKRARDGHPNSLSSAAARYRSVVEMMVRVSLAIDDPDIQRRLGMNAVQLEEVLPILAKLKSEFHTFCERLAYMDHATVEASGQQLQTLLDAIQQRLHEDQVQQLRKFSDQKHAPGPQPPTSDVPSRRP